MGKNDNESWKEFLEIYGLSVIEIPTHKPMVRKDNNDQIYKTPREKYDAVLNLVIEKWVTSV